MTGTYQSTTLLNFTIDMYWLGIVLSPQPPTLTEINRNKQNNEKIYDADKNSCPLICKNNFVFEVCLFYFLPKFLRIININNIHVKKY